MEYRKLGSTGLKISALSYGSYLTVGHHVDYKNARKLMSLAYDQGINFFDTAEIYSLGQAEEILGNCIKDLQWNRDTYTIGSKVFWGGPKPTQTGLHRKHIMEGCHASLKRLKVDYLDFFLCHRPDAETSIIETVWSMHQLIQQGKILYWGTSEWNVQQIMEAHMVAKQNNLLPPSCEQFQYNIFKRLKAEKEFISLFKAGVGAFTTMPLAGGILTSKYKNYILEDSPIKHLQSSVLQEMFGYKTGEELLDKVEKVQKVTTELEITLAQFVICWCLKNSYITSVIFGASNEHQLQENIDSLNFVHKITPSLMERIDEILGNRPDNESIPTASYEEIIKIC